MDERMLLRLIEENKKELFALLKEFVKVDSQNFSSYGNEKNMAEKICNVAKKTGFPSEKYSPLDIKGLRESDDYFDGRNLENRLNADVVFKGKENENALLLMGHIDTVPVGDISAWTVSPFENPITDGKIYGRGACDDKYSAATVLFLFDLLKKNGFVPKKNIIFSAYCDEEYGGSHGAMASCIKNPASRIVNMDGKFFRINNVAIGGGDVDIYFRVNAAVDSADITARLLPIVIEEIDRFGERRKAELRCNEYYKDSPFCDEALMYLEIRCGKDGNDLGDGYISFEFFTDKTEDVIRTELNETVDRINERLKDKNAVCMPYKKATRHFHYGVSAESEENIKALQSAAQRAVGITPEVTGACLTDLSVIIRYGGKTAVNFGLGRGFNEDGGAHQKNEFIECDMIVKYAKTIGLYILDCLG